MTRPSDPDSRSTASEATLSCKFFPDCSGCQSIGTAYGHQLEEKLKSVRSLFSDTAVPEFHPRSIRSIRPSPHTNHYRNRIKLVPSRGSGGKLRLGLYQTGTHDVVDIPDCPVQHSTLNRAADAVRQAVDACGVPIFDEASRTGDLRYVTLRVGIRSGQLLAGMVTSVESCGWIEGFVGVLRGACPNLAGVVQNINSAPGNAIFGDRSVARFGDGFLEEVVGGIRIRLGLASFFQVNTDVAELAYGALLRHLQADRRSIFIDLFAGVGVIGLIAASSVHRVIGIESVEEAVELAEQSARLNGIANCEFRLGTVEDQLRPVLFELASLGVSRGQLSVILNPPRKGVQADVLDRLMKVGPARMAYLSCDPRTLVRDLKILAAGGYMTRHVELFDMFPQTDKVETLAIVERKRTTARKPVRRHVVHKGARSRKKRA